MIKIGFEKRHYCLACGGKLVNKTAICLSAGYNGTTHTLAICGKCALEMRSLLDDIDGNKIEETESEEQNETRF